MKENRRYYDIVFIGLIFSLLVGFRMYAAEQNQLCKIFHHGLHKGNGQHGRAVLEIGKIVFYFAKDPEIRLISNEHLNDQRKQLIFLFPMISIKDNECRAMMDALRNDGNQWYNVALEQVQRPAPGLRFSILYDPRTIEMTYDTFDSIGLYKGVVFTFYNKMLLEKMKDKSQPLIHVVANDKKPDVIIDCGHGGNDTGAIGCGNLQEKEVTLQVGLNVATLLRRKGINTLLTRDRDVFVPLDKRTSCMNMDPSHSIFISIHTNSADNKKASGIETFCLSPPLLKRNFKTMSDYSVRLLEYITLDKYKKSQILATRLHHHLILSACQKNHQLIDRHVKHAVSQILLGTIVPSVLIELGFLSNDQEAALLKNAEYQQALAAGICTGILDYFNSAKSLS